MPRLLDLFCGAGGAAVGYAHAGFEVIGVDIAYQKNYPYEFAQMGWLEGWDKYGEWADVVHASPPCQAYSITSHAFPHMQGKYPRYIEPVQLALHQLGKPYVIENVPRSAPPLRADLMLCGSMFGLSAHDPDLDKLVYLKRHRLFESNMKLEQPVDDCRQYRGSIAGVYGGGGIERKQAREGKPRRGGYTPRADVRRELMQMPWATMKECNEGIPPAYTEYIGRQILEQIQ